MSGGSRLKWMLRERDQRAGSHADSLPLLSVSIEWGVRRRDESAINQAASDDLSKYKIVRRHDVVLNRMRAFQGALGLAPEDGLVSPDYAVLECREAVDPVWLSAAMRSAPIVAEMASRIRGIGGVESAQVRTPRINVQDLLDIRLWIPSMSQQRAIADFLDRETAQIDAMTEAQRELVARLQERKSAMITRALGSSQDAGVVKLAWVFTFHNGDRGASYPSREELVQDGVPFINAGHLTGRSIDLSTMNYITDEKFSRMGGAKLHRGDILFCVRGSLGKTGLFDVDGSGALASSLVALRRSQPSVDVSFYLYLLGGIRTADQIRLAQTGSAQPNLAVDQLAQFRYEVPALEEQQAIAGYLDGETGRIDSVIEATNESINLMNERRSALISAAVTGRIDPRTGRESVLDKVGVSA